MPIAGMAYMLASARNRVKELKEDAFLGKSTIVFGEIQGGVHRTRFRQSAKYQWICAWYRHIISKM